MVNSSLKIISVLILSIGLCLPTQAQRDDLIRQYTDNKIHHLTSVGIAYRDYLIEAYKQEKVIHDKITAMRIKLTDEDCRYFVNTNINGGEGCNLFIIEDDLWWSGTQYLHDFDFLNNEWSKCKQ